MQRRNTMQRLAVLKAIDVLGHTTSDELIQYMGKIQSDVSLATIYRNLGILVEEGQVRKLKLGDFDVYETIKEKHYHFICKSCGKIMDIPTSNINPMDIPKDFMDNEISDYDLVLFGYCKNCRSN